MTGIAAAVGSEDTRCMIAAYHRAMIVTALAGGGVILAAHLEGRQRFGGCHGRPVSGTLIEARAVFADGRPTGGVEKSREHP
jgi:hypothetical protein